MLVAQLCREESCDYRLLCKAGSGAQHRCGLIKIERQEAARVFGGIYFRAEICVSGSRAHLRGWLSSFRYC